ncbi:DUF935 family protein [Treponema sp.]|uniref:phage portal protein family protein n=1 Tax=Treponema sp. TaxID=166 RepID=UPI00298E6434|nr:DUF935 family protein [Treponema sp.]
MAKKSELTTNIINLQGFRSIAGYMLESQNWLSSVNERDDVFQKMMDDPRIGSLFLERKNRVLQMYGSFTQTGNRKVDEACEQLLNFNLFYKLNNTLLNAVPYGLAACEVKWRFVEGYFVPYDFTPIPRTALSFPLNSDVDFMTPILSYKNLPLDNEQKFLIHRNDDGELRRWGRPALQMCYMFWKFKSLGVKFWAQAAEILSAPSILALFDARTDGEARKTAKELTEAMNGWTGGSSGALGNVRDIKIISSQINDFNTIVETCDTQIAYAVTAQSLTTNQAQYGTHAQGETHVQTFDSIIKGDAYALQLTDQKLVNAFVAVNFPGEVAPKFDIDSTDFAPWDMVRDAIDRGVPVSLSAMYRKYHLAKPEDEKDVFVKQQAGFGFSDSSTDFFLTR